MSEVKHLLSRQFVDAVKQLCKDFSDRQGRPYMGDVYAALDGLLEHEQIPVATPQDEQPETPAWIACSERKPPSGQTVLAFYLNTYGMERRIRAQHVDAWTIQADDLSDPDTECFEYSEQEDAYYLPAGWYECIDNWGDYSSIAVNEGIVTHWLPLPAAPTLLAEQFCDGRCTWLDHHPDCKLNKEHQ